MKEIGSSEEVDLAFVVRYLRCNPVLVFGKQGRLFYVVQFIVLSRLC
jgi:hypothetical protein